MKSTRLNPRRSPGMADHDADLQRMGSKDGAHLHRLGSEEQVAPWCCDWNGGPRAIVGMCNASGSMQVRRGRPNPGQRGWMVIGRGRGRIMIVDGQRAGRSPLR